MTRQEAYKILGINESKNTEEIKKAYKAKAKKYHPDIYQGDKAFAEEKMKQINEAYSLLSTPTTFSTDYSYGSKAYNFAEEFQRARHEQMRREHEEHWKKVMEDLERMQKEMEESNRKMKKMFKRFLTFLFCTLEFYIILLFANAVRSIIFYFNERLWFFFAYFILLALLALSGVILAPIGFRWLLKRAGITK